MANLFIYIGLGILLCVSVFGVYVALRALKAAGWKLVPSFPPSPAVRRLTFIWGIGMFIGFVSLLIGMGIALQ